MNTRHETRRDTTSQMHEKERKNCIGVTQATALTPPWKPIWVIKPLSYQAAFQTTYWLFWREGPQHQNPTAWHATAQLLGGGREIEVGGEFPITAMPPDRNHLVYHDYRTYYHKCGCWEPCCSYATFHSPSAPLPQIMKVGKKFANSNCQCRGILAKTSRLSLY